MANKSKKHFMNCKEEMLLLDGKIYSPEIVLQTAISFLDKGWIFVDGNPDEKIMVFLKPKKPEYKNFAGEFSNELITYQAFCARRELFHHIREKFLKRAFFSIIKETDEEKFKQKMLEKQKITLGLKVPIMDTKISYSKKKERTSFPSR
jgi:hypothetical protein